MGKNQHMIIWVKITFYLKYHSRINIYVSIQKEHMYNNPFNLQIFYDNPI